MIIPYLVFQGNCKEAMQFYAQALDGKIKFMQTFKESPIDVPEEANDLIYNSELNAGDLVFKASDNLPDFPIREGTNISLFTVFPDEEAKVKAFNNLSNGGKVLFPIEDDFGMLKDKFGIQWMVVHGDGH